MQLFWHRRDPRTRDNAGLAAAARAGRVVPVFVYDADLLGTMGARQRAFFPRHVNRLEARYRELGSDLVVRAGAPDEVLVDRKTGTSARSASSRQRSGSVERPLLINDCSWRAPRATALGCREALKRVTRLP